MYHAVPRVGRSYGDYPSQNAALIVIIRVVTGRPHGRVAKRRCEERAMNAYGVDLIAAPISVNANAEFELPNSQWFELAFQVRQKLVR